MQTFNATDAIFFGFRVIKRDPLLFLTLIVLTVIVNIVGAQFMASDTATFMNALQRFSSGSAAATPAEAEAMLREMFATYGAYFGAPSIYLTFLALAVVWLVVQGALLRQLVRDRREGWIFGVQLGGDELRILVVSLVVWVLISLLFTGLYILCVLVIFIVGALAGTAGTALGVLFGIVAMCVCVLALALASVRLSAAAAASVGERKFIVFGSWALTKGHMWGLLGAYVVQFFIIFIAALVVLVAQMILTPNAVALAQNGVSSTAAEDLKAALQSPAYAVVMTLSGVLSVLSSAARSGVGAYAYRTLGSRVGYQNAELPEDVASNFA
jgi:hypothetical protein